MQKQKKEGNRKLTIQETFNLICRMKLSSPKCSVLDVVPSWSISQLLFLHIWLVLISDWSGFMITINPQKALTAYKK